MFVLKSIFGKVWGDPNVTDLVTLKTGELFITRPRSSPKGARECLFHNAMATVRRTETEFHYQLVITRVYEEGEENLLDEDDETDDERAFLLDTALEFRSSTWDGQATFVWRDLEGDEEDLYEFIANGSDQRERAYFETAVLKAMYERKHHKSSERVKESDLKKLAYIPPSITPENHSKNPPTVGIIAEKLAKTKLSSGSRVDPSALSEDQSEEPDGRVTLCEPAELLCFDYEEDAFAHEAMVDAKIILSNYGDFNYFLATDDDEKHRLLLHPLTTALNCKWSQALTSFRWNHDQPHLQAWCLRFADPEAYERFRSAVTRCFWESNFGMSWEKAKKEDASYVEDAYRDNDVEMTDAGASDEDEEDAVEEALGSEEEEDASDSHGGLREEDSEESDEEGTRQFYGQTTGGEKNTALAVGYKSDRTFVLRGPRIGVFKHRNDRQDGGVEHAGTINKVTNMKGKAFTPTKLMLHEQDRAMVLMNPLEPHNLYKMDLEAGKVVEEWKVHPDVNVEHIAPDSKFAQTEPGQTLVGASHNGLFRIDPRLSGNKLVDSEFKQYVTKAAFSGVATSAAGHLAVASEKGDIRLFDSIGKIAKTALPALGDPIIGIDVTASGRWVVATCKTHIYVIDTLINDGRYSGKLGFERSFPANARPLPKRLQLKPEHVLYMGSDVSFTPARFDTGPDLDETTIVTSSGRYVIAWDFKKIKKGILDKYEIKQYDDKVVQDQFRFANDNDIVVALNNNVLTVNKKKLKKPTRNSLANSSRGSKSKSEIVNAPY